jgi:hypothetical protein
MSVANQTIGHSAANPGLRGHSCGSNYPLTVIAKGIIGQGLHWLVLNCKTGEESNPRRSYKEAEIDLYSIRMRNCMHS